MAPERGFVRLVCSEFRSTETSPAFPSITLPWRRSSLIFLNADDSEGAPNNLSRSFEDIDSVPTPDCPVTFSPKPAQRPECSGACQARSKRCEGPGPPCLPLPLLLDQSVSTPQTRTPHPPPHSVQAPDQPPRCCIGLTAGQESSLEHPHTVPADGAVGLEVEGHQVFWMCGSKSFILVLTTVPPHTDSLGVSTKTKAGLDTEDDPLPF
ncbi:hypothetical protein NFI96_012087 [Prochilodus magdalenae]|nr:hypothetical protein NFI96_012087 [Prochilodus magdalenae]